MEHRTDNPCDRIGSMLGLQRDIVRHMRALPHREVAAALEQIRASRSTRAVKLAFGLLVVTAARSGEMRLATVASDLKLAKWMLGTNLVVSTGILIRLFLG